MKPLLPIFCLLLAALAGCTEHRMMGADAIEGLGKPVPILLAQKWAAPRVEGTINGVEGTFLLDTGSTMCSLSEDFCRRAHLAGYGQFSQVPLPDGTARRAAIVWVPEMRLGDVIIRGFSATQDDHPPALKVDGLIGADVLLSRAPLTFNKRDRSIVWGPRTDGTAVPLRVLPAVDQAVTWVFVMATFAGERREFLLDTGSNFSFLDSNHYTGPVEYSNRDVPFITSHESEVLRKVAYVPDGDVFLGDVHARLICLVVKDPHGRNVMGFDLCEGYSITIDARHKTLYIRPDN
jgi:hypothetical protein